MKRKPDPEMIDDENPEWTDQMFEEAVPFSALQQGLQEKLLRATRGPQKAPTKKQITLRLSENVVEHFRSTCKGWQTRIDEALQEIVKQREAA